MKIPERRRLSGNSAVTLRVEIPLLNVKAQLLPQPGCAGVFGRRESAGACFVLCDVEAERMLEGSCVKTEAILICWQGPWVAAWVDFIGY